MENQEIMKKVKLALKKKDGEYILAKKLEDDIFLYVEISNGDDPSDKYFHVGIGREVKPNHFVDTKVQPFILERNDLEKIPEKLAYLEKHFH